MNLTYETRAVEFLIRKHRYIDVWFPFRYSFDIQSGCIFDCIYCRVNWRKEKKLIKKKNILLVLEKELGQFHTPTLFGIGGGYNEIFTPADLRLTEAVIRVVVNRGHRVFLMTKNAVLAYDSLMHFKNIPANQRPIILVSISSIIDKEMEGVEMELSPVSKRMEAVYKLREAGFIVGIAVMPLIPFFNDEEIRLRGLFEKAASAEVDFVLMDFIDFNGLQRIYDGAGKALWSRSTKEELATTLKKVRYFLEDPKQWKAYQKQAYEKQIGWLRESRLLPFLRCKEFYGYVSRKDAVTLMLLQLYYYNEFSSNSREGYRFAAYSLNKTSESKFSELTKRGRLMELSGVGAYLGGASGGLIHQFLRGEVGSYEAKVQAFLDG